MLVDIVPYLAERQALYIEMQGFGYDLLWICHVLKSIMLYEPFLAAIAEILLLEHVLVPLLPCFIVENLTKNPLEKGFDSRRFSTASEKQKNKFEKMCFSL
jgi:hypothetical protein